MPYTVTIEGHPQTWNKFYTSHWTANYKYKQAVQKQMLAAINKTKKPEKPITEAVLNIHLGFKGKRRSDITDLCTKPHVDCLVDHGIIADDNRFVIKAAFISWQESESNWTTFTLTEL